MKWVERLKNNPDQVTVFLASFLGFSVISGVVLLNIYGQGNCIIMTWGGTPPPEADYCSFLDQWLETIALLSGIVGAGLTLLIYRYKYQ